MSWIRDILNNWDCDNEYQGSHTFTEAEMKQEIDNKHPFCVFWHWSNGGGHFVDIYGYTNDIFHIMNPWSPNVGAWQRGDYDYVKNAQNRGYWRGTVWTTMDVNPFVRIMSPNGGGKWDQFSTRVITWGPNVTGNVKVELLKGNNVMLMLENSIPCDSSLIWNIPLDIETGDDYKIKVTSLDNDTCIDESDKDFSIVNK